jgi:hypothetical protein
VLLGMKPVPPVRTASTGTRKAQPGGPVTQGAAAGAPAPTVEMIRGDKRTAEVIR